MMHSSLAQPNESPSGYVGGMDFYRLSELYPAVLGKTDIGQKFTFVGASVRHTSSQMREQVIEGVAAYAMDIAIDLTAVPAQARFISVRPRKEEAEPLWLANINHRQSSIELHAITCSVKSLFDQLDAKGADSVNDCLGKVNVHESNDYHLIAILRSLFKGRNQLSNWREVERRTRIELADRGLDAVRIMKGLDAV